MWYMGGKHRQAKKIAEALVSRYTGQTVYHEPFAGAMGAALKTVPALAKLGVGYFVLSDVSRPLMTMWQAVTYGGWVPPEFISEEMYLKIKAKMNLDDPLTAYCGHAVSFGGKWFGGYARNSKGGSPEDAKRQQVQLKSVLEKAQVLREHSCQLMCGSYDDFGYNDQVLVYCDPPYIGRTKPHKYEDKFDHDKFWGFFKKCESDIIATEFIAPEGWRSIHSWGDTVVRHHASKGSDDTNEQIWERI